MEKSNWNIQNKFCLYFILYQLTANYEFSTVAPRDDVKVEDTWNFFIVLTVRGGQGE